MSRHVRSRLIRLTALSTFPIDGLGGANLTNANLIDAFLSHANLTCACLSDANLTNAKLTGTRLRMSGGASAGRSLLEPGDSVS
ncbi:pentapeptide repeat-containing protein [Streptomyces sp. NPDC048442]|uniref:pentapeptide repeat-containing protein n=1 Tax=Streptomyces sp. NPDC048442 TaxID=3154823 RepID=UPI00341D85E8